RLRPPPPSGCAGPRWRVRPRAWPERPGRGGPCCSSRRVRSDAGGGRLARARRGALPRRRSPLAPPRAKVTRLANRTVQAAARAAHPSLPEQGGSPVPDSFPFIMISAMYENGGNTTQRLLDGHPELFSYPFESQPGTKYVLDHLTSV